MVNAAGDLLVHKSDTWRFPIPVLAAAIIVLIRWRADVLLLAVSVGAILMGTALFATWTRAVRQLLVSDGHDRAGADVRDGDCGDPLSARSTRRCRGVPRRRRAGAADTGRASEGLFQLSAVSREIRNRIDEAGGHGAEALRDIRVNFPDAHPTIDKYLIYRILGGRINPGTPIAFINEGGDVRIE